MSASQYMRDVLERGDVREFQKINPKKLSYSEAEVVLHLARTSADSVSLRKRAYSHKFLLERGIPSLLPDEFKPAADRINAGIQEAVGISVKCSNPLLLPVVKEVHRAMETVVLDMFANGDQNRVNTMKQRMQDARKRVLKATVG